MGPTRENQPIAECTECKRLLSRTCEAMEAYLTAIASMHEASVREDAGAAASLKPVLERAREVCEQAILADRLHLAMHLPLGSTDCR